MNPIYASRRRIDIIIKFLCLGAALFGVTWLALILFTLFYNGLAGINLAVFTQDTPPPGSTDGGLRNAIIGSIIMTVIGVGIGAPLGLFAGTYLAEYGKHDKLTSVIRFINDILLSAPSIIIGLFIYGAIVVPMGGFSAFAGCLALAVIVIPVVVRTTEDMLGLVPNPLREAASALGLPRSLVIKRIAYRAARAGLITGVLLATARVAGETAPLLFTALSNQFFSLDLTKTMANLPVTINNFVQSPYAYWKQLAWSGALADHAHRTCPEYWRAHPWRREDSQMTDLSVSVSSASGPVPQVALPEAPPKVTARGLNFYYGEHHALKNINLDARHQPRHRLHRPVRLRQVHAAADLQPDVRPLSRPARDRAVDARPDQHPRPQARSQSAARPRRHGVPEADAVPDDDLRKHRLRHPPLREDLQVRDGRPGREGAARRRAVERGQGQAERLAASRFPAASSSGSASPARSRCGPR